jgi:hypothetical protein
MSLEGVKYVDGHLEQSYKISHIDMGDDHMDTLISHIISPYPISISRMTISIWKITLSIYCIPNRYPNSHIDYHIDVSFTSGPPCRSPISISHIDIGSYLVTLIWSDSCQALPSGPSKRFVATADRLCCKASMQGLTPFP